MRSVSWIFRMAVTSAILMGVGGCAEHRVELDREGIDDETETGAELFQSYADVRALLADAASNQVKNSIVIDGVRRHTGPLPTIYFMTHPRSGALFYASGPSVRGLPLVLGFSDLTGKYDSTEELAERARALGFQSCITLNGRQIHSGATPCLALEDPAGTEATNVPSHGGTLAAQATQGNIVVTHAALAGTYTSEAELIERATAIRFDSCILFEGRRIYHGFGPCLTVVRQPGGTVSAPVTAPVTAPVPPPITAPAVIPTTSAPLPATSAGAIIVNYAPLAGTYSSEAELVERATAVKFDNCILFERRRIYHGFGPCLTVVRQSSGPTFTPAPVVTPAPTAAPAPTTRPSPQPTTTPRPATNGDPGYGTGTWQPPGTNGLYVVDQSGVNGGSGASIVPGCVNGGSMTYEDPCRKLTAYGGVQLTQGKIVSIRYRVKKDAPTSAYSGSFRLRNIIGGGLFYKQTISLSTIPGDFSNPACTLSTQRSPNIAIGTAHCPISKDKSLYYLNIRLDQPCRECIFVVGEESNELY
ncbi:MAG: hypothetical protein NDJ89_14260 [Oligoflexia bacterium]|nr:hypothetical protein [Oligoflexia bacterium]